MRKKGTLILALALTALLSGCFFQSMDELYALPQQSEEYYDLQSKIDGLLQGGAAYAAPTSGSNRQSVQLADLDGDGVEEAVVFLRTTEEKPLRAYIFDRIGDSFENVAVIEGDGNSFASVEYQQIDGEPGMEIVLGRQISDQVLQSMSIYALRDNRVVELMSASYTSYTTADLDQDGNTDIFVLRFSAEERTGVAEYYRYVAGQIEREPEALLSNGVEAVRRIIAGQVDDGVPAVFVASMFEENSIITDIFALRDGGFVNITTEGVSGTSAQTIRNYYVYATDIDSDGVIELPQPRQLPRYDEASQEDVYWLIDWYRLNIDGTRRRTMTTYHNYSGGWFVVLPEEWNGAVSITRESEVSGVRGYTINQWKGYAEPPAPVFTIYAFSGEDRHEVAQAGGRFVLGEKGDVTYAAARGESEWCRALSDEEMVQMFRFIHVDWNSGEI
ncbi:MAG: hypothetical protein HFF17_10115 [Oscillospiraceae bacterium]|nr:hypothetical protein [Oscillospiraceae bacterium]